MPRWSSAALTAEQTTAPMSALADRSSESFRSASSVAAVLLPDWNSSTIRPFTGDREIHVGAGRVLGRDERLGDCGNG